MKNLYIKLIKYYVVCLTLLLERAMRYLILLNAKNQVTMFEVMQKADSGISKNQHRFKDFKGPTYTFGDKFFRAEMQDNFKDTGKGETIVIPRSEIGPSKNNEMKF